MKIRPRSGERQVHPLVEVRQVHPDEAASEILPAAAVLLKAQGGLADLVPHENVLHLVSGRIEGIAGIPAGGDRAGPAVDHHEVPLRAPDQEGVPEGPVFVGLEAEGDPLGRTLRSEIVHDVGIPSATHERDPENGSVAGKADLVRLEG